MKKNDKLIGCIIARLNSKRLTKKVVRKIGGHFNQLSLLDFLIIRAKNSEFFDEIFLCTGNTDEDLPLREVAIKHNIRFYAGDPDDVSERILHCAKISNANYVARITGDNPFTLFEFIGIQKMLLDNFDYVRCGNMPIGTTAELFSVNALRHILKYVDSNETEYMMLFLFDPKVLNVCVVYADECSYSDLSLTVDTIEDFNRFKKYAELLKDRSFDKKIWLNLKKFLDKNRLNDSLTIDNNLMVKLPKNKTCLYKDFKNDMKNRYKNSTKLFLKKW